MREGQIISIFGKNGKKQKETVKKRSVFRKNSCSQSGHFSKEGVESNAVCGSFAKCVVARTMKMGGLQHIGCYQGVKMR